MDQENLTQNSDLDELESLSVNEEKVEKRRLRPLASFLEFDLSHRPTQAKDRISKKRVGRGIALGVLLIVLGFAADFEIANKNSLFSGFDESAASTAGGTLSAAWLFVALGVFLIVTRLMLMLYGRDFFIGHKFAAVVIQKPFEHSNRMADSLGEYLGVRYRTRIVNVFGLTSFTQHIIDLQHPNEAKTIPLYITKNGEDITRKWEELARQMQKPAIFNTADGIVEISPEDITRTVPELIESGKISVSDKDLYKVPSTVRIVENADYCQIDPQIRDSAFSVFSGLACFCAFFAILFFGFVFHMKLSYLPIAVAGLVLFVMIPLSLFFRRKRIVVSKDGIRVKSRWLFFPSFGFLIKPENLEYIYVIHNSYDFKYTMVIGANGQTAHIGRGLPKADLEWLRNFVDAQIKRFVCGQRV